MLAVEVKVTLPAHCDEFLTDKAWRKTIPLTCHPYLRDESSRCCRCRPRAPAVLQAASVRTAVARRPGRDSRRLIIVVAAHWRIRNQLSTPKPWALSQLVLRAYLRTYGYLLARYGYGSDRCPLSSLAPPARLSCFSLSLFVHRFLLNDINRGGLLFEDVDGVTPRVTYDEANDQVAGYGC